MTDKLQPQAASAFQEGQSWPGLQSMSRTDRGSYKEQYKYSSTIFRLPSAQRQGVGKSVSESTEDREKRGALLSLKSSGNLDTLLPFPFPCSPLSFLWKLLSSQGLSYVSSNPEVSKKSETLWLANCLHFLGNYVNKQTDSDFKSFSLYDWPQFCPWLSPNPVKERNIIVLWLTNDKFSEICFWWILSKGMNEGYEWKSFVNLK